MKHGYTPAWTPNEVPEIYAFADYILKGDTSAFGRITKQPSQRDLELTYASQLPVVEATVYYLDEELTYRRESPKAKHPTVSKWKTMQAEVDSSHNEVRLQLPTTALTYYVNLKDSRACIFSSVLVEL